MSGDDHSNPSKAKRCFVIAPIGAAGSPERMRSNQVFRHILLPVLEECGYAQDKVVRSDLEATPGLITTQIVEHLVDDELVIADLTGHNPNVFYELALRHAIRKPIVQLMEVGDRIPFDVNQMRTIMVDHHDLDSVAKCREDLKNTIRLVEEDATLVDSPISHALDIRSWSQSPASDERRDAQLMRAIDSLANRVDLLAARIGRQEYIGHQSSVREDEVLWKSKVVRRAIERQLRDRQIRPSNAMVDDLSSVALTVLPDQFSPHALDSTVADLIERMFTQSPIREAVENS